MGQVRQDEVRSRQVKLIYIKFGQGGFEYDNKDEVYMNILS